MGEPVKLSKLDSILFRINVVLVVIFFGSNIMIDSGITDIQILVANAISSLLMSILIIYALLQTQTREKLMRKLNDIPFSSGMICTFGLGIVCLAIDPTRYKHFTDYTLTFVTVPLGAYFFIITLWSRTKYMEKPKKVEP